MARRPRPGDPHLAVGYLRVSTDRQDLGPDAQRAAIAAWAARTATRVVAWHEDRGVSGAADLADRPGLLAALADLRAHGAGVLVAAKRDRVARDTVVAALVERAAVAAGAALRTADGASDAAGPEGVMMKGIVDVFATYERAVIRARTRAALAAKKARGERAGKVPYGFAAGADGRLVPCAAEQAVIDQVRQLRGAGLPLRAVVGRLVAAGIVSRAGTPLGLTQVARLVRGAR